MSLLVHEKNLIQVENNVYKSYSNSKNNNNVNIYYYWELLKRFWNNKKVPIIPHFFSHGNEYITDFKESNSIEIPLNIHHITEKRLDILNFCNNDNEQIIQNLDPNKAQGHENISILHGKNLR